MIHEEEKTEAFKQALLQAFPSQYEKIYGDEDSIPDWAEQRVPESDEEYDEITALFGALWDKKTVSLDKLI